jgi:hypothetical protein
VERNFVGDSDHAQPQRRTDQHPQRGLMHRAHRLRRRRLQLSRFDYPTDAGGGVEGDHLDDRDTPKPGGTNSHLTAVSCTAANACVSVGYHAHGSANPLTLVEVWDGTTWAIQSAPKPKDTIGGGLAGSACTASASCVAVGTYYTIADIDLALAEAEGGDSTAHWGYYWAELASRYSTISLRAPWTPRRGPMHSPRPLFLQGCNCTLGWARLLPSVAQSR